MAKGTLGQTTFPGRQQVGCVAKTHRDAERCVIASSTHPTGLRPSPAGARLDPSLELNQGDPPCSSPPWPPGPQQGWAACSDRFWLLELRVFSTFLNILRLICSGPGCPTQCAATTSCPRSDRFWLLELRVSRIFLDKLRPQLSVLLFSRGGVSSKTRRTWCLQPLKRKLLQGGLNSTTPAVAAAVFSLPSRHASGRPRRMASSR